MEMEHDLQHPAQNSPARTSSTSPGLSTLITLGNTQPRAETRRAATANVRLESWWWWWWWWWGHMDPHSAHKDIVTMVRDSCTHGSMQPAQHQHTTYKHSYKAHCSAMLSAAITITAAARAVRPPNTTDMSYNLPSRARNKPSQNLRRPLLEPSSD